MWRFRHTSPHLPSWHADSRSALGAEMRKDVREFIRRLEAVGLTVESTPGTTTSCATASRSAKRMGCRLRCRSLLTRSAGAEPRSSNYASSVSTCSSAGRRDAEARRPFGHRASTTKRSHPRPRLSSETCGSPLYQLDPLVSLRRLPPGPRSDLRGDTPGRCAARA